jgi:hypothetical protein
MLSARDTLFSGINAADSDGSTDRAMRSTLAVLPYDLGLRSRLKSVQATSRFH